MIALEINILKIEKIEGMKMKSHLAMTKSKIPSWKKKNLKLNQLKRTTKLNLCVLRKAKTINLIFALYFLPNGPGDLEDLLFCL